MSLLERFTGRFVGVGGPIVDALWAPGEPALGCRVIGDTVTTPIGGHASYAGRGFGVDRADTTGAAVGEMVERYGLLDLFHDRVGWATAAELRARGTPYVPPAALLGMTGPDARQGAFAPVPADDQPLLWIPGTELGREVETLLPARFCLMLDDGPTGRAHAEGHWYCGTSNGAATAATPAAACLGGLLELLERDAFMLLWYHRLTFRYLRVPPASRLARRLTTAAGTSRLDLRLIDLSEVHGVPVVVAAVRGAIGDDVQYGIGGGAALTLTEATWKAAKEAYAFYRWQRKQLARGGFRALRPEQVRTFADHPTYYMDRTHQSELDFLFTDRPAVEVPVAEPAGPPPAQALPALVSRLADAGTAVYAVDVTPPGLAEVGPVTYKVVAPGLIPIDWDHQARHLGYERLRTEPSRRGWRPDEPALSDLNHAPHPFP